MNKKLLMTSFMAACTLGAFTLAAADEKPAPPRKQEQRQKGAPKVNMKALEEAARIAVEQFNAENNDANRAKMNEAVGALVDARLKAAVEKNQKDAEKLKVRMNNRDQEIEDAIKRINQPKKGKEKGEVILFNDTLQGKEGEKKPAAPAKAPEKKPVRKMSPEEQATRKALTEAERKEVKELSMKLMMADLNTADGKAELAKLNGLFAKAQPGSKPISPRRRPIRRKRRSWPPRRPRWPPASPKPKTRPRSTPRKRSTCRSVRTRRSNPSPISKPLSLERGRLFLYARHGR